MTHNWAGRFGTFGNHIHTYLPETIRRKMTTTTDIAYTDEWIGTSSAISEAVYDKETSTLYLEVSGGSTYAYDNVPSEVWREFKNSYSKGAYYATRIKRNYGPGRHLGYSALDDATERSYDAPDFGPITTVNNTFVGTPKNLTYAPDAVVTEVPRTFNLQAPLLKDTLKHTVRFDVVDGAAGKEYAVDAADVTEAVAKVNEIGDALGLEFKVTEVVTHFE